MLRALITVALVGIGGAPAGSAAAPDGVVIRLQGEAEAFKAGHRRTLGRGSKLQEGARVETGSQARVRIRMRDGTKISLGADSVFRISRYQPEAEEDPGAVFKLLEGVFRAVTGALTDDGGSLQVETRVATVGVRGTDFWGGYFFSDALDVILLEGTGVRVRNEAGTVVLNRPRERTTVIGPGQPPNQPAPIAPERLERAAASVAFD